MRAFEPLPDGRVRARRAHLALGRQAVGVQGDAPARNALAADPRGIDIRSAGPDRHGLVPADPAVLRGLGHADADALRAEEAAVDERRGRAVLRRLGRAAGPSVGQVAAGLETRVFREVVRTFEQPRVRRRIGRGFDRIRAPGRAVTRSRAVAGRAKRPGDIVRPRGAGRHLAGHEQRVTQDVVRHRLPAIADGNRGRVERPAQAARQRREVAREQRRPERPVLEVQDADGGAVRRRGRDLRRLAQVHPFGPRRRRRQRRRVRGGIEVVGHAPGRRVIEINIVRDRDARGRLNGEREDAALRHGTLADGPAGRVGQAVQKFRPIGRDDADRLGPCAGEVGLALGLADGQRHRVAGDGAAGAVRDGHRHPSAPVAVAGEVERMMPRDLRGRQSHTRPGRGRRRRRAHRRRRSRQRSAGERGKQDRHDEGVASHGAGSFASGSAGTSRSGVGANSLVRYSVRPSAP